MKDLVEDLKKIINNNENKHRLELAEAMKELQKYRLEEKLFKDLESEYEKKVNSMQEFVQEYFQRKRNHKDT